MWQAERVANRSLDTHLTGDGLAHAVDQPGVNNIEKLHNNVFGYFDLCHGIFPCVMTDW